MYLSQLLINVGTNPDRPLPGRLWLRNMYRVHQRLCMAFPSADRVAVDKEFISPYAPEDFAAAFLRSDAQVHQMRDCETGFLFRVDSLPGQAAILVQSAIEPKWDYAFQNAKCLLAVAPSEPRRVKLEIPAGMQLRFQLVAHPTKREALTKSERLAQGGKVKRPRTGVEREKLGEWLEGHAEPKCTKPESPGFHVDQVSVDTGFVYMNKTHDPEKGSSLLSAKFEGVLTITDGTRFLRTLRRGIGPAKAFGFGLLSVARM